MRTMRKILALVLGVLLVLGLCACGEEETEAVSVQSVGMITGIGPVGLNNRYAGVVEAGQTVAVEKDEQLQIKDLLVAAGDKVEEGQPLFTYNTETIALELDKLRLELEQLKTSLTTKEKQIEDLEKEKAKAGKDDQLSYTLQIQELQIDVAEAGLNIAAKEKEVARMERNLETSEVLSPISGRVQSVNENGGTDEMGNPLPFISLLETESYRVKGNINEQNAGALGIGEPVVIRSRVDEDQIWTGCVKLVDWENPVRSNMGYWGEGEDMSQSSKYPFYVSLDGDEGLMLGQHVFIEPGVPAQASETLMLPAWVVNDPEGEPWVWAVDAKEKLEKRTLSLGDYDPETDSYPVLSGLALTDYVAPDSEQCKVGAPVVYYSQEDFEVPQGELDFGAIDGMEDTGFDDGFFGGEEGEAWTPEDGKDYGAEDGGEGPVLTWGEEEGEPEVEVSPLTPGADG